MLSLQAVAQCRAASSSLRPFRAARSRRPCPVRRCRERSACRNACRARGRRRRSGRPVARADSCGGRRARRRPSGRRSCARVIDARSTLSSMTLNGTLPTACTASVWNSTPRSWQSSPISRMGCSTPISLLAGMMRDQDGLVVHGALQVVEIDAAVLLHRQIGDAEAVLLQPLAGVEHGLVLGGLGDDVVALLAIHLGHALDGEVVALGGAAR